jgi:hypothetical protein
VSEEERERQNERVFESRAQMRKKNDISRLVEI